VKGNLAVQDVVECLDQIIGVCAWDGSLWADVFRQAQVALLNGDWSVIRSIIGFYGGTGSFNDLVVGQGRDKAGGFAWREGYQAMNDRLDKYRRLLYTRCCALLAAVEADANTDASVRRPAADEG
jgi:hypothetical protein